MRSIQATLYCLHDFEADGVVEAVQVRHGDMSPDGSGPLSFERGVGRPCDGLLHIEQFGYGFGFTAYMLYLLGLLA